MRRRRWDLLGPPLGCCCSLALWLELEVVREGGRMGRKRERKKQEETEEWPRGKRETTMMGCRELPKHKQRPLNIHTGE